MGVNNNFRTAPQRVSLTEDYLKLLMKSINSAMAGKLNCTGEFTVTASATSTVVTDNNCLTNSVVLLTPTTSNAAAAIASTYITTSSGSFTVTHANNGQTDRTFRYAILG